MQNNAAQYFFPLEPCAACGTGLQRFLGEIIIPSEKESTHLRITELKIPELRDFPAFRAIFIIWLP